MSHAKCQRCGSGGVEMFDACPDCQWENDPVLEDASGVFHRVDYDLTPDQRRMWSAANGDYAVQSSASKG